MRFHITVMRPGGNGAFYVQAFHEVVESLCYAISALGHDVSFRANVFIPGAQNVILGAQFADPESPIPDGSICFNLEQLGANPMHLISPDLSKRFKIWEYSSKNMDYWREHGVDAVHVPIGYCPQLSRIAPINYPDLDVLFIGSISPRRAKIIRDLQEIPDLKFHLGVGFGKERDPLIARSKVILNMHYYPSHQLFEQVRCSYLLANRKALVCETSTDFPVYLDGAVRVATYDELVCACVELARDVEQRLHFQRRGFELFSKIRMVDILRPILTQLLPT